MDTKEIQAFRQRLGKTQKQMSQLLGISLRAIQSFEQGWRKVPVHIERQMFFLVAMKNRSDENTQACWEIRGCPPPTREACPAWEFPAGHICWFINGTICQGKPKASWSQKMKVCRKCQVFVANLKR
ncbi:MAG: helix-turn-helix transcriptional regulator [Pseudomonadota bacterium]